MTSRLLLVAVALAPLMSVLVAQAPAGGVSRAVHRSTDDWPATVEGLNRLDTLR